MDRTELGAGDSGHGFQTRWRDPIWLYDPETEEFARITGPSLPPDSDVRFRGATLYARPMPQTRWGRVAHRLFVMGWMFPITIGGIMLFALLGWLAGYR